MATVDPNESSLLTQWLEFVYNLKVRPFDAINGYIEHTMLTTQDNAARLMCVLYIYCCFIFLVCIGELLD